MIEGNTRYFPVFGGKIFVANCTVIWRFFFFFQTIRLSNSNPPPAAHAPVARVYDCVKRESRWAATLLHRGVDATQLRVATKQGKHEILASKKTAFIDFQVDPNFPLENGIIRGMAYLISFFGETKEQVMRFPLGETEVAWIP